MGLKDLFFRKDAKTVQESLVVTGRVKGTIRVGDAVYISNPGEDNDNTFLTTIVGIETAPNVMAKVASDCAVGVRLEKGKLYKIKKGTVLYTRDADSDTE